ncbi:MAG: protein-L-isoaspartate O-methyltransferase, partial [Anaerolineaceae bacterium]
MKTFRINKFILITILVILFSIIFWVAFKSSKNQSGSTFLEEDFRQQRLEMVSKTIENRGVTDSNVLNAMRNVPRHQFVPEEYKEHSYKDHPLPIGYGQTISQPYIVAWM